MLNLETIKEHIINWKIALVIEEITEDNIKADFAKELFLFLYDYTNSFKNANTTPEILILAWKTLTFWIEHDKLIVDKTKKTLTQMKLCWKIIENINLYWNNRIAGAVIDKDTINESWADMCIWESIMANILITISDIDFCFLAIERESNSYEFVFGSKYEKNRINEIKEKLNLSETNNTVYAEDFDSIIKQIEDIYNN